MEIQRKDRAFAPPAELTAPISGTVTQRLVGPGQFVQAGSTNAVFAIGDLDRLWLIGNVREEDATQMRVGEAVDVVVPALPGRTFPARLTWVALGDRYHDPPPGGAGRDRQSTACSSPPCSPPC